MRSTRHPLNAAVDHPRASLAILGAALLAALAIGAASLAATVRAATLAGAEADALAMVARLAPLQSGYATPDQRPAMMAGQDVEPTPLAMAEPSRWRCADVPPAVMPEAVRAWCAEIDAAADAWGMDPRALALVVAIECPWGDPACGSPAGAQGLAQVMPATAATIAAQTGLACTDGPNGVTLDPAMNLRCGAYYLAGGLRSAAEVWRAGDEAAHVAIAGAGYNAGHGRIPALVAHWRAGGHVCDASLPAETQTYCRHMYDGWQLLDASPAPLDAALGVTWRGRP